VGRLRQAALGLAGLALAWLVALALVGWLGDGCARRRVEARLAASMRATAAVGAADLGLVTGGLALRDLRIERRERGHLAITVA
jgi:hypothetical protein